MALDTGGNVKVDFVWGNFPMQPDDARSGDGNPTVVSAANAAQNHAWSGYSVTASPALTKTAISKALNYGITISVPNNHSVAENNWNGYPDYTPVAPFLDTVDQALVPNVVGLTEAAAGTALTNAGFVKGAVTTTTAGSLFAISAVVATDGPDTVELTIGSHSIQSGESVDVTITTTDGGWNTVSGTKTVTAVTATTITFVDAAVSSDDSRALEGSVVRTSVVGKVKTQTPAAGTNSNLGTSVALVKYAAS